VTVIINNKIQTDRHIYTVCVCVCVEDSSSHLQDTELETKKTDRESTNSLLLRFGMQ
jgi:hypothetical protein